MELLESNDPKNVLLKKSAKHKKELEEEVKLLSEGTEKIIKNALIIGGTLAVTYFLVRQFSRSKSKGKSKPKKVRLSRESDSEEATGSTEETLEPSVVSQIGSAIAAQATVFLLDLAKDKLASFIQTHFDKKPDTNNERS